MKQMNQNLYILLDNSHRRDRQISLGSFRLLVPPTSLQKVGAPKKGLCRLLQWFIRARTVLFSLSESSCQRSFNRSRWGPSLPTGEVWALPWSLCFMKNRMGFVSVLRGKRSVVITDNSFITEPHHLLSSNLLSNLALYNSPLPHS